MSVGNRQVESAWVWWPVRFGTLAWLTPLLVLAGCSLPTDTRGTQQPIVDGRACMANENPSAVALIASVRASDGQASGRILVPVCGGVLIASDVVLTAAHCLEESDLREDVEELGVAVESIGFGVSWQANLQANPYLLPSTPADWVDGTAWEVHPEFDFPSFDALRQTTTLSDYHDLGLLYLKTPVQAIAPARLLEPKRDTPAVGAPASVIGWGIRKDDVAIENVSDRGIVQCAEVSIDEVGSHELRLQGAANKCQGDSGSPTYWGTGQDARVIGLGSHLIGNPEDCSGGSIDVRPDAYADWLIAAMVGACLDGHRQDCASPSLLGFEMFDAGVPPSGDAGTVDGGDDRSLPGDDDCRIHRSHAPIYSLLWLVLGLLASSGRRRAIRVR